MSTLYFYVSVKLQFVSQIHVILGFNGNNFFAENKRQSFSWIAV